LPSPAFGMGNIWSSTNRTLLGNFYLDHSGMSIAAYLPLFSQTLRP
jgi:hypothetical protein